MKGGAHRSPPFSAGSRIDDDDVIKYSRRWWWWSRLISQKEKKFSQFFQMLPIHTAASQPAGHPNIPKLKRMITQRCFQKTNEGGFSLEKEEREREKGRERNLFDFEKMEKRRRGFDRKTTQLTCSSQLRRWRQWRIQRPTCEPLRGLVTITSIYFSSIPC